jgi:hypothetical protein
MRREQRREHPTGNCMMQDEHQVFCTQRQPHQQPAAAPSISSGAV